MSKSSKLLSGRELGFPYSFSRWTDVPIDKWAWFEELLKTREMVAYHPEQWVPYRWSLRPDDTLGLVFWTKDPTNVMWAKLQERGYKIKVHVTVTGWKEEEGKAPDHWQGGMNLAMAADILGPQNVIWRFSPVPILPHQVIVDRFEYIMVQAAERGIDHVYLSFLQENDRMPETRDVQDRLNILVELAQVAQSRDFKIYLCNEDRLLAGSPNLHPNLASGVCAPPEDFELPGRAKPPSEGCGCVLMVDPFNINEACSVGCTYCYAASRDQSPKRTDTTKHRLSVLRHDHR